MRTIRDQLIFKALVALDEAADQCGDGPVKPTFSIRFALAYLYAVSDGRRDPFDGFWREMQQPHSSDPGEMGHYIRGTAARTNLTGIIRGVGCPETVEFGLSLHHARKPKAERHAIEEKERRLEQHRRDLADGTIARAQWEERQRQDEEWKQRRAGRDT